MSLSHCWITALNLTSALTGGAAALLLYWGSLSVPWKLQTWSGESAVEQRYERTRRMMKWVGIPCVGIAVICQVIVAVAQ
jgi:hypothetical protein